MLYGSIEKNGVKVEIHTDLVGNIRLKQYGNVTPRMKRIFESIDLTDRPIKVLAEISKAFK